MRWAGFADRETTRDWLSLIIAQYIVTLLISEAFSVPHERLSLAEQTVVPEFAALGTRPRLVAFTT